MNKAAAPSVTSSATPGERRLVSVLFTDMVGYTAIVDRLGEEASVHFTRMIYDMLTGVVQDYGGVVRGFAGDSIMAVFGIPEALEDAALRACRTGMAIHAVFRDNADGIERRFGVRPIMRVGVSSGSVVMAAVEGEGAQMTAVGNTVNLASRIQALAPEGGCLICDTTRRLVEWLVDLSFDGEHSIKGVAREQKLWQLQSVHDGATRFDASLARGLSQYVGRDAELSSLSAALEHCPDGLQVVDLVAEPGLGKTRLVFEFLGRARTTKTAVFTGHCTADGQQVPFLPFIEVVRSSFRLYVEDEPDVVAAKLQEGLRRSGLDGAENLGLLMNLLGLDPPAGALDGLDGVLIGLRTHDLLPALLKAQSNQGRVVLLIEDIHWIDGASEDLLQRLIDGGDLANLLILLTRRPEYLPAWQTAPMIETLELNPLGEDDIRHLVQTRLGVDRLPEALVGQVVERAGGNPLFGEEVLSFLMEKGALQVSDGTVIYHASKDGDVLPTSMQSLLTARIDQLRPEDRRLLQAAAAIGRRFDPGLLAVVAATADATGAALQRLQANDIVHRQSNSSDYMFRHVLLRDTVYQSLLSDRRTELHLAIATALEQRNANRLPEAAEKLAYHFAQTDRSEQAFTYNAMAGAKSLGVFSHDQANQYFAAALALYEQDPGCASDAAFAGFIANYALCSNISLAVMTMIGLAPRVRPILNRMGDSHEHVLFLHHYVSCLICNTRFFEAISVQQDLNAMAQRLGDEKSIAYALVNDLSVSIYCASIPNAEFEAKKARIEAALATFDDAYLQNFYLATVGWNELTRGRVLGARKSAERMVADGEANKDPRSLGYGTAMKALVAVVTDDHQTALELSEHALRLSRAEFELAIAESSRVSALVPLEKPGARETVQRYLEMTDAKGTTLFGGVPQTMLGVALALEGRVSEGLRQMEDTIAQREAEGAQIAADWNRLFLSEVYLQILSGEGGASLGVLLRNFGKLVGVMVQGEKRIIALIERARQNPQFDADGHYYARGEMILGLLCKLKKKKPQAIAHLTTAHKLIAPTGASPMLTRIEDALADLAA